MKRRLRMKKRIGEFQELAFYVGFRFEPNLSQDARNSLLDRFITLAIEANDLQFGGGGGENLWTGVAELNRRGSATETQRQAVERWLLEEPLVTEYCVGPLADGTHGDFSDPPRAAWKRKA